MDYLNLAISFAKVGVLSFGGGYAMIPLIKEEVASFGIGTREFVDILGLSQVTPGPLGVNASTYAGFKVGGFLGSVVATFANILPSFIIMLLVAIFLFKHRKNKFFEKFFSFLRPIFIGLIISAVVGMILDTKMFLDYKSVVLFVLAFLLLLRFKLHPILLMIIFGIMGLLIY